MTMVISRVELYERGDMRWTCEDKGEHNHACGTKELPSLVSCKRWLTGRGEVKWECAPAESKHWRLNHTHSCLTPRDCALHTIVTPRSEITPIFMAILVVLIIAVLFCASSGDESGAFWGGYWGSALGGDWGEDDDWGGSSWS